MAYRRPIVALNRLAPEASFSLAKLAGLEGFARAVVVGVLPLVALKTFGDKATISTVYFFAALFTLLITLNIATLERLLQRRWVVTLGSAFLILAAILLYLQKGPLFALGLGLRSAGASIFSVCMSLYIMDYIGKRDLPRNESIRIQHLATAWIIAPPIGVWLYDHAHPGAVFGLSIFAALIAIRYFWYLRLGSDQVIQAARSKPVNPLRSISRYLHQSRLRIAYGITLSRSCYWVAVFVYGPIYVVEAGLPAWVGGLLLSAINALLLLSPLVRRLAERFGTRQVIISSSILIGASLVALGFMGAAKPIGLLFWLIGALGAAGLDVLGNIPFMRSVKPRERTEMTMIFSTWREGSELLTQAIVFGVLLVAPFWAFYFVLAAMQFGAAIGTSYLPRRL